MMGTNSVGCTEWERDFDPVTEQPKPALKKDDRVVVTIPIWGRRAKCFTGRIVGEARDGHAWQIIKDGTTHPRGIHKTFVEPEPAHEQPQSV